MCVVGRVDIFSKLNASGVLLFFFFFFQAEDGIRDLVRSRGLGDVYKRQSIGSAEPMLILISSAVCSPMSRLYFLRM